MRDWLTNLALCTVLHGLVDKSTQTSQMVVFYWAMARAVNVWELCPRLWKVSSGWRFWNSWWFGKLELVC